MRIDPPHRPRVMAFNKSYLPGFRGGGPVRTLASMVERLGDEFSFHIVTLDRDAGDDAPYADVAVGQWTNNGKARVFYAARQSLSVASIARIINDAAPDVLYLNSFFDPVFTQRVLRARRLGEIADIPVVLAPRGEFSSGALRLKQIRKAAYVRVAGLAGLYDGLYWQASSPLERQDIANRFPPAHLANIMVAPNLVALRVDDEDRPVHAAANDGVLKICFLGRIAPMKNLDFAIRVLARTGMAIEFSIYGPMTDPEYWASCQALMDDLPPDVRAVYHGEIHPSDVRGCLRRHDLFFLPTRGENFGHVIHEALEAGLPVLISDQTPWNDVKAREIGWALPLDAVDPFVAAIHEYASWPADRRRAASRAAMRYAAERSVDAQTLDSNRTLFLRPMMESGRLLHHREP